MKLRGDLGVAIYVEDEDYTRIYIGNGTRICIDGDHSKEFTKGQEVEISITAVPPYIDGSGK